MTRQFHYKAQRVNLQLDIRNDGTIFDSRGTRCGKCRDVNEAVDFCRRIGWVYTINGYPQ